MKSKHDLSKMKSTKNPYAKCLKKQVTIRLGEDVIDYFKALSDETGIPYQNLINMYLLECVEKKRRPTMEWVS